MIFLTAAPILMWPMALWATPVIMAFVAFLLLGTENIGVQIEEPFSVLPLDAICSAIEGNLKEMERQYLIAARPHNFSSFSPPPADLKTSIVADGQTCPSCLPAELNE